MSDLEQSVIDKIMSGEISNITWDEISIHMEEKQEELDLEVKKIERLDNEAQQLSMTSYVR